MKSLANTVIVVGLISLVIGIIVKLANIAPFGPSRYPFIPLSFLRFAAVCFVLVVALAAAKIIGKKE